MFSFDPRTSFPNHELRSNYTIMTRWCNPGRGPYHDQTRTCLRLVRSNHNVRVFLKNIPFAICRWKRHATFRSQKRSPCDQLQIRKTKTLQSDHDLCSWARRWNSRKAAPSNRAMHDVHNERPRAYIDASPMPSSPPFAIGRFVRLQAGMAHPSMGASSQ